mgnify:FL=1
MDYKSRYLDLIEWGRKHEKNILIGLALALGFLIGLGSGLLTNSNQVSPIIIDKNIKVGLSTPENYKASGNSNVPKKTVVFGNFMASINGKAYYPANCEAAKRIKEENRIWFRSKEEAEADGYKPAQNCP